MILEEIIVHFFDEKLDALNKKFELELTLEKQKFEQKFKENEMIFNKDIDNESTRIQQSIILNARLDIRKNILNSKRNLIDTIIKKITNEFRNMVDMKVYYSYFKNKLNTFLNSGFIETVVVNYEDVDFFTKEFHKLNIQPVDFLKGGFILENKNMNIDCSLENLITTHIHLIEEFVESSYGL